MPMVECLWGNAPQAFLTVTCDKNRRSCGLWTLLVIFILRDKLWFMDDSFEKPIMAFMPL
jgi:hypothetical protein